MGLARLIAIFTTHRLKSVKVSNIMDVMEIPIISLQEMIVSLIVEWVDVRMVELPNEMNSANSWFVLRQTIVPQHMNVPPSLLVTQ